MDDTSPEIAAMMQKMLMMRPGVERLVMGCQMFEVARTMALASMPPDLSEREIKVRLCERLYGDQVDLAAFASRLGHS